MKKLFRFILILFIFILLTIISQIGGFIFLLSLWLTKQININFKLKPLIIFLMLYLASTLIIAPLIAPIFGRETVKNSEKIEATSYITFFSLYLFG